jgi:hypothetical protein
MNQEERKAEKVRAYSKEAERVKAYLNTLRSSIYHNFNLEEDLKDIERMIIETDEEIATMKAEGITIDDFDTIRNDMFYLKWKILEKM